MRLKNDRFSSEFSIEAESEQNSLPSNENILVVLLLLLLAVVVVVVSLEKACT
jgi:hypothetical protein